MIIIIVMVVVSRTVRLLSLVTRGTERRRNHGSEDFERPLQPFTFSATACMPER
jgi:hypothetical protein